MKGRHRAMAPVVFVPPTFAAQDCRNLGVHYKALRVRRDNSANIAEANENKEGVNTAWTVCVGSSRAFIGIFWSAACAKGASRREHRKRIRVSCLRFSRVFSRRV